jgi:hypothetical protein
MCYTIYSPKACFALRVWVLGLAFGFALRCVALFCAVYEWLHLVMFLAGGLSLPSLCETVKIHQSRRHKDCTESWSVYPNLNDIGMTAFYAVECTTLWPLCFLSPLMPLLALAT